MKDDIKNHEFNSFLDLLHVNQTEVTTADKFLLQRILKDEKLSIHSGRLFSITIGGFCGIMFHHVFFIFPIWSYFNGEIVLSKVSSIEDTVSLLNTNDTKCVNSCTGCDKCAKQN